MRTVALPTSLYRAAERLRDLRRWRNLPTDVRGLEQALVA